MIDHQRTDEQASRANVAGLEFARGRHQQHEIHRQSGQSGGQVVDRGSTQGHPDRQDHVVEGCRRRRSADHGGEPASGVGGRAIIVSKFLGGVEITDKARVMQDLWAIAVDRRPSSGCHQLRQRIQHHGRDRGHSRNGNQYDTLSGDQGATQRRREEIDRRRGEIRRGKIACRARQAPNCRSAIGGTRDYPLDEIRADTSWRPRSLYAANIEARDRPTLPMKKRVRILQHGNVSDFVHFRSQSSV